MYKRKPPRTLRSADIDYILKKQLDTQPPDTVLDLGCGDGIVLAKALAQGCHRVIGIDSNAHSLKSIETTLDKYGFSSWVTKTWGRPGMWGLRAQVVNKQTRTTHTLHIVCADLEILRLTDLNSMDIFFPQHECTKIYMYGTVWQKSVKLGAIRLINNIPGKPRLAWITAGKPEEPASLGINQEVFPLQSNASIAHLQTETKLPEIMSSFLYGDIVFDKPTGWRAEASQRKKRSVIAITQLLVNEAQALREWKAFKEECRIERFSKREAIAKAMLVEIVNPNDDQDEGEMLFEEQISEDDDDVDVSTEGFIVNYPFDNFI